MKKLAEESWSWTLFEDGDRLVLSVLSGGVAMIDVNIALTSEEKAAWEREGVSALQPMIKAIQADSRAYPDRRVQLPA